MVAPTNTFLTTGARGNRESLSQMIYLISQTATPFFSSIPDETVTSRVPRWQADELTAASSENKNLEGDETTADATRATDEFANPTQIFKKSPRVSRTQIRVNSAGRGNEMSYQVEKRALEMKRDIEASLLANKPGDNTTTDATEKDASGGTEATGGRQLAGLPAWAQNIVLATNSSGTAATGVATTAATINADVGFPQAAFDLTVDGAGAIGNGQPLNENNFVQVMQETYDQGGAPDCVLLSTFLKTRFSDFRGFNRREIDAASKEIYQTFDIYHTDFGPVEVVPDVFFNTWINSTNITDADERSRTLNSYLIAVEKEKVAVGYLDDFELVPLAKTGDSEHKQLTAELTLINRNPNAHGFLIGINDNANTVVKS